MCEKKRPIPGVSLLIILVFFIPFVAPIIRGESVKQTYDDLKSCDNSKKLAAKLGL